AGTIHRMGGAGANGVGVAPDTAATSSRSASIVHAMLSLQPPLVQLGVPRTRHSLGAMSWRGGGSERRPRASNMPLSELNSGDGQVSASTISVRCIGRQK